MVNLNYNSLNLFSTICIVKEIEGGASRYAFYVLGWPNRWLAPNTAWEMLLKYYPLVSQGSSVKSSFARITPRSNNRSTHPIEHNIRRRESNVLRSDKFLQEIISCTYCEQLFHFLVQPHLWYAFEQSTNWFKDACCSKSVQRMIFQYCKVLLFTEHQHG